MMEEENVQVNLTQDPSILIHAQGLRRYFGDTCAVDNLNLDIRTGEIYALMGPDGAGKTTTMRLLSGILRPDAGQIDLAGVSLQEHPEAARTKIGYLSQSFSLYEDLSVLENIRFFAEVHGVRRADWRDRAGDVLRFVDMEAFSGRLAGALSGGMKQKLALAIALVHQPPILLLDEPTSGVDPITRQAFWRLITRLLSEGVAVLLTTPYMDEAARCSRVGFLHNGRLVIEGAPQDLAASLEGRMLMLRGAPLRLWVHVARALPYVEITQPFGDNLHLVVNEGKLEEVRQKLQAESERSRELMLETIEPIPATLEDAFVSILQQEGS
jgi:ABC-2 type transport system ATP-binding protein